MIDGMFTEENTDTIGLYHEESSGKEETTDSAWKSHNLLSLGT